MSQVWFGYMKALQGYELTSCVQGAGDAGHGRVHGEHRHPPPDITLGPGGPLVDAQEEEEEVRQAACGADGG